MAETASEYSTLKRPSIGVVASWNTSTCSARRLTAQSIDVMSAGASDDSSTMSITASIAGWSAPQQAKRLKISPLLASSSGPSSAVGAVVSASPNTARKPCSPSSTESSATKPRSVNSTACTPWKAAWPACSGLTLVPKFLRMPADEAAAMPTALRTPSASRPTRRPTAAATPSTLTVPIECQPR